MMTGLTRYEFRIRQSGTEGIFESWNGAPPAELNWQLYHRIVRRLDSDAQAEHHAREISRERGGIWVQIKRADASWGLRSHDTP